MHALAEQLVWLSLSTALCGPVRELVRGSIGKNWTAFLVQKFDAHTVQDLSELTEGDLQSAGLTVEQRRRLRTALDDHMRFLPKGRTQIQIKRDQVLQTVMDEIHLEGGAPSLSNVLAATGTGNWAPRFAALGVRAWDDLLLLTDDDFTELGMNVLHARRTQALLSRISNETRQLGLSTLRHDAYPAAMRPLPEDVGAMLRRVNLSIYAQALAGHGIHSIAQLAGSSHATLSASGVKLVQRRQLLSFARMVLHQRGHPSLTKKLSSGSPPINASSYGSRRTTNGNLFDGCRHVFLDVGANVGINLRHYWDARKYRWGPVQPVFDRYIGHTRALRRNKHVCAYAFEANPHHARNLRKVEAELNSEGFRATISVPTAVADREGTISSFPASSSAGICRGPHIIHFRLEGSTRFFFDDWSKRQRDHYHEWSASMFQHDDLHRTASGWAKNTTVRTIDLAQFILSQVLNRTFDHEEPVSDDTLRPSIIMKIDIEGAEFAVLSRMMALGVLCHIDVVAIEFHDERRKGFIPLAKATQVPPNFAKNLEFIIAHGGKDCKVNLVELSPVGS